jgi:hypothetical protein
MLRQIKHSDVPLFVNHRETEDIERLRTKFSAKPLCSTNDKIWLERKFDVANKDKKMQTQLPYFTIRENSGN